MGSVSFVVFVPFSSYHRQKSAPPLARLFLALNPLVPLLVVLDLVERAAAPVGDFINPFTNVARKNATERG
jgi:hypothetical protein